MESRINKRKNRESQGTSCSVAMEDTLKLNQQQQFTNTKCKMEKDKPQLQWGDIYQAIKEKNMHYDYYMREYKGMLSKCMEQHSQDTIESSRCNTMHFSLCRYN